LYSFIAAVFAPLLSMFINSGLTLLPMAFIKNICADVRCLFLVNCIVSAKSELLYFSLRYQFIYITIQFPVAIIIFILRYWKTLI